MKVDLARVRELVEVVQASRVTELSVKGPGGTITVRRSLSSAPPPAAAGPAPSNGSAPASEAPAETDETAGTIVTVRSPAVGYVRLQLGTAANTRLEVGDLVNDQQLLCIISSMNVPTEVVAPRAGRIAAFHVKADQPVEYGQRLLEIEPT